jgi:hypothetical protein
MRPTLAIALAAEAPFFVNQDASLDGRRDCFRVAGRPELVG